MPDSPNDTYPEPEAVARREALLKRMLTTPKKPKSSKSVDERHSR